MSIKFAGWCNGSTAGSGPVSLGSSPSPATMAIAVGFLSDQEILMGMSTYRNGMSHFNTPGLSSSVISK